MALWTAKWKQKLSCKHEDKSVNKHIKRDLEDQSNYTNIAGYDQVSEKPKQDQKWSLLYTEYWYKDEFSEPQLLMT